MSHCGYHSVDTIDAMKTTLQKLRDQLASDTDYFRHVYNYTFEFSRPPGQRSLGTYHLVGMLLSPSVPRLTYRLTAH